MKVAVKRIRIPLVGDMVVAESLAREVKLWAKLDHPNILRLLGFFLVGEKATPNLVSEWMEKGTLTDYMKERPPDAKEICAMVLRTSRPLPK